LLALLGTVVPAGHGQALEPPVAPRIPYVVKSPQGDRVDDYHWMRDDDPKVKRAEIMAYLRAEKAYADAFMAPLQPLKARLVAEMRARIKEDDSSVPAPDGAFEYFVSYVTGGQYPRLCRRPRGGGALFRRKHQSRGVARRQETGDDSQQER